MGQNGELREPSGQLGPCKLYSMKRLGIITGPLL